MVDHETVGAVNMIGVGIGCRRGVSGAEIADLVRRALSEAGVDGPVALFSTDRKADEKGLFDAAQLLNMPLVLVKEEALRAVAGAAATCSSRVEALFGLPSIAETAALAGAGSGAKLILPRLSAGGVTCAVAARPEIFPGTR
jgi:cobalt-precorrin 5A hydrolase